MVTNGECLASSYWVKIFLGRFSFVRIYLFRHLRPGLFPCRLKQICPQVVELGMIRWYLKMMMSGKAKAFSRLKRRSRGSIPGRWTGGTIWCRRFLVEAANARIGGRWLRRYWLISSIKSTTNSSETNANRSDYLSINDDGRNLANNDTNSEDDMFVLDIWYSSFGKEGDGYLPVGLAFYCRDPTRRERKRSRFAIAERGVI